MKYVQYKFRLEEHNEKEMKLSGDCLPLFPQITRVHISYLPFWNMNYNVQILELGCVSLKWEALFY